MKVLLERFPYRYIECGTLEINGMPDYRIQKADNLIDAVHFDADGQRELGKRYFKEYLRLIE